MPFELASNEGFKQAGGAIAQQGEIRVNDFVRAQIDDDRSNAAIIMEKRRNEVDKWLDDNPDQAYDESQNLTNFKKMYSDEAKKQLVANLKTPDAKREAANMFDFARTRHQFAYQSQATAINVKNNEISLKAGLEFWQRQAESATSEADFRMAKAEMYNLLEKGKNNRLLNLNDQNVYANIEHDLLAKSAMGYIQRAAVATNDETEAGKIIDSYAKQMQQSHAGFKFTPDEIDKLKQDTGWAIMHNKKLQQNAFSTTKGQWTKDTIGLIQAGTPEEAMKYLRSIDLTSYSGDDATEAAATVERLMSITREWSRTGKIESDETKKAQMTVNAELYRTGNISAEEYQKRYNDNSAFLSPSDQADFFNLLVDVPNKALNDDVTAATSDFKALYGNADAFEFSIKYNKWLKDNPKASDEDKFAQARWIGNKIASQTKISNSESVNKAWNLIDQVKTKEITPERAVEQLDDMRKTGQLSNTDYQRYRSRVNAETRNPQAETIFTPQKIQTTLGILQRGYNSEAGDISNAYESVDYLLGELGPGWAEISPEAATLLRQRYPDQMWDSKMNPVERPKTRREYKKIPAGRRFYDAATGKIYIKGE